MNIAKYINIGLAVAAMAIPSTAKADLLDEAAEFIGAGDLDSAKTRLEQARTEGEPEAYIGLARIAMLNYDFDEANRLLSTYENAKKKAKREVSQGFTEASDALALAEEFLERVERIEVIDSLYVPKKDFFKHYRIPSSAGRLLESSAIPFPEGKMDSPLLFANENVDFMMWSQPDSVGYCKIMESSLLTDGHWSNPVETPVPENSERNAKYPFMMSDGVTLYYAADGDGSIGGLDIFIASRDAASGEYLQPKNIGMPYNSPYDDYMMAIDEENGVGWWATDRNRLGKYITIYVYKVNDLRDNYPSDSDDILDKARISDYRSTWAPDSDNNELLATLKNISPDEMPTRPDFMFPLPGGGYYTSLDDFPDSASRLLMQQYLKSKEEYDKEAEELSSLRKKYHNGHDSALVARIKKLEKSTASQRKKLAAIKSDIYKSLKI